MNSYKPVPKVGAAGISGVLATLITWALSEYGGTEVPAEIAALLTTVITFAVAYMMPDANVKRLKEQYEELKRGNEDRPSTS